MTGPIKPDEVAARKTAIIPDKVFEVFNDAIAAAWDGHGATIMQDKIASKISTALGISRSEVFNRHLLDVEGSYRAVGWSVEYDKPGYNETYEASFRFTHDKRAR